jgi:hypothetical protein
MWKWAGEVLSPDGGRSTLTWTERGYHGADEHPRKDDLLPIEPEAPNPAKSRVDLALAAINYRRACEAMEAARESVGIARDALVAVVKQRGRDPVVVKIDGLYFLFEFHDTQIEFSEIEVL